jgi:hypothetical protein
MEPDRLRSGLIDERLNGRNVLRVQSFSDHSGRSKAQSVPAEPLLDDHIVSML